MLASDIFRSRGLMKTAHVRRNVPYKLAVVCHFALRTVNDSDVTIDDERATSSRSCHVPKLDG